MIKTRDYYSNFEIFLIRRLESCLIERGNVVNLITCIPHHYPDPFSFFGGSLFKNERKKRKNDLELFLKALKTLSVVFNSFVIITGTSQLLPIYQHVFKKSIFIYHQHGLSDYIKNFSDYYSKTNYIKVLFLKIRDLIERLLFFYSRYTQDIIYEHIYLIDFERDDIRHAILSFFDSYNKSDFKLELKNESNIRNILINFPLFFNSLFVDNHYEKVLTYFYQVIIDDTHNLTTTKIHRFFLKTRFDYKIEIGMIDSLVSELKSRLINFVNIEIIYFPYLDKEPVEVMIRKLNIHALYSPLSFSLLFSSFLYDNLEIFQYDIDVSNIRSHLLLPGIRASDLNLYHNELFSKIPQLKILKKIL
jgi:hypothetical protein